MCVSVCLNVNEHPKVCLFWMPAALSLLICLLAGRFHPARRGFVPWEQAVSPMPPHLHHNDETVLHGRHSHTLQHYQWPDCQLQHYQVSFSVFVWSFSQRHFSSCWVNVTLMLYMCWCVVGSPGLTIRIKTWTSLFLHSAFTVTTMTQLGWVAPNIKENH